MPKSHMWMRASALLFAAVALSGCFDLTQKIAIGRNGGGRYEASIAAGGIVGEGLRDRHGRTDLAGNNHALTVTRESNGIVTQTSSVDFKSLSDLNFSDQSISLTERGHALFGLGPAEMTFRRSFLVDRARREHAGDDAQSGRLGREIAQSLLGNRTYVFSVTLPGSIERIAPIVIGSMAIRPEITGDFINGHTITWRMPLYMLVDAHALNFEVDFSAYGWFGDVTTRRT